ncbi:hypothetical protein SDC9_200673 [bioreactor metagenome]|uniref:Uncharacterized protein n=1 Tax=bioreactor metagenome TaxID=1076179 RepID=A0A645IPR2_9ZZZZ
MDLVILLRGIPVRTPTYMDVSNKAINALTLSFKTRNNSIATAETTIKVKKSVDIFTGMEDFWFQAV